MNTPTSLLIKKDPGLRQDFADDGHWLELARLLGYRLPPYGYAATEANMRNWLYKVRMTKKQYFEITGYSTLLDFVSLNPDWPLRAFVGLLLEYCHEIRQAEKILRGYER